MNAATALTIHKVLRILHFHDNVPDDLQPLSDEKLHSLINQHLSRDDETLAELKQERRPGRPPTSKQTLLEQRLAAEQKEYEQGFWMPDMQNERNLGRLKEWKGHWVSLGQLTFVRVEKGGNVRESAFPPSGAA